MYKKGSTDLDKHNNRAIFATTSYIIFQSVATMKKRDSIKL